MQSVYDGEAVWGQLHQPVSHMPPASRMCMLGDTPCQAGCTLVSTPRVSKFSSMQV